VWLLAVGFVAGAREAPTVTAGRPAIASGTIYSVTSTSDSLVLRAEITNVDVAGADASTAAAIRARSAPPPQPDGWVRAVHDLATAEPLDNEGAARWRALASGDLRAISELSIAQGTISSLDRAGNTLVLSGGLDAKEIFLVEGGTVVRAGDGPLPWDELQWNSPAGLRYIVVGGGEHALEVIAVMDEQ
jgi:hypothetical protein